MHKISLTVKSESFTAKERRAIEITAKRAIKYLLLGRFVKKINILPLAWSPGHPDDMTGLTVSPSKKVPHWTIYVEPQQDLAEMRSTTMHEVLHVALSVLRKHPNTITVPKMKRAKTGYLTFQLDDLEERICRLIEEPEEVLEG